MKKVLWLIVVAVVCIAAGNILSPYLQNSFRPGSAFNRLLGAVQFVGFAPYGLDLSVFVVTLGFQLKFTLTGVLLALSGCFVFLSFTGSRFIPGPRPGQEDEPKPND